MPTIYRFGEGTKHHRIYVDDDTFPRGPVTLFDHSGPTPDQTDDGPLHVLPNTKGLVTFSRGTILIDVPVWVQRRSETAFTVVTTTVWKTLVQLLPSLTLIRDQAYEDLVTQVLEMELLMHARTSATTYGSVTGRMTSGSAALLDLPRDSPVKSSSPVVNVDYADLELRVLAGLSPEEQRRAYGGTD